MKLTPTHCDACAALYAECGEELFAHYSKRLLEKGWAGKYSPVERKFRAAHTEQNENMKANLEKARAARKSRQATA